MCTAGLIIFAGLTCWLLFQLYGHGTPSDQARLEGVRTVGTIVLGAGGAVALLLTARRQQTAERDLAAKRFELALREKANDDIKYDAAERRITELYLKAVEQLGSDKAPVRLAGLYALERLAQDNEPQRQTILNVISAYLRMPYGLPGAFPEMETGSDTRREQQLGLQEREVRITAQRIITEHLNPDGAPERFWQEIDLDLNNATLIDFSLRGCQIRRSNFSRTDFTGEALFLGVSFTEEARFDGATFENAWFTDSNFTGSVRFDRANFTGEARFENTSFAGNVTFRESTFLSEARFDRSIFTGSTVFSKANFSRNANFSDASFIEDAWLPGVAFIQDAYFKGAKFSRDAWFNQATFSGNTTFENASFSGDIRFEDATLDGTPYEPPELNPRPLDPD